MQYNTHTLKERHTYIARVRKSDTHAHTIFRTVGDAVVEHLTLNTEAQSLNPLDVASELREFRSLHIASVHAAI